MERTLTLCFAIALMIALSPHTSAQTYFPPVGSATWETVSPAELGWCTEELDSLYAFLDRNGTRAFIVLKDGRIAIEWYAEEFEATDTWYWASAGKVVTATLIGMAKRNGDLRLDDRSSDYLGAGWSSLTMQQENRITVRHHLTMTTGLDDGVEDPYCTDKACLTYKSDAGTRWAYHNGPYTLLDKVIQTATGSTLNVYYAQRLRETIGMDGLFVKQGFNNVLLSTPRAMARFGLLTISDFVWDGTPILDDANYVSEMLNTSQILNPSYGYLWWLNGKSTFMIPGVQAQLPGPLIPNAPMDAVNALGKNNQILSVSKSTGLVVVRMGDAAGEDGSVVPTVFPNNMWRALRKVICNILTSTDEDDANLHRRTPEVAPRVVSEQVVVLNAEQPVDAEVYDVTGALRLRISNSTSVDLGSLEAGVYAMRVSGSTSVQLLLYMPSGR